MSDDVLSLAVDSKKIIHYPFYLNSNERPHRLYPLIDVSIQIAQIVLFICLLEMAMFMSVNAGGPPELALLIGGLIPTLVMSSKIFLRNTRLTVTDAGISFPLLMAFGLGGRLFRAWSDIDSIDMHEGKDYLNLVTGNVLTITFKSGGSVNVDLTRVPREDIRLLQESLIKFTDLANANVLSDAVARNDLEINDSQMYVFAKRHRSLISSSFGLTNSDLLCRGDAVIGGDYLVESALCASGGQASYLVNDVKIGRVVCMTEYDLSVVEPSRRDQVGTELLELGQSFLNLQIPNLLNLLDMRVDSGKFYTVMEPRTPNLRKFIERHKCLGEKEVLSLALKLAEAVECFQNRLPGASISGIRPDSVSYERNGTLSIGELGFAEDVLMKYSNTLLVDAPYAAPERICGEGSSRGDLYSIGATMYFALTGMDPIPNAGSSVRAIRSAVSQSTTNLVSRLLNPDPSLRGNVQELIIDLGGFVRETHAIGSASSADGQNSANLNSSLKSGAEHE